ncbi:CHAT domain-containing protein [Frigoriglobus tundricola]|uniref:CHAT domain-containing protein n=1 Tax=Frigoriglobus tundricola TaxID=2774151 RepID=A0A6M5YX14_9BACT|nr:CHAT domain-containing protein [Frigoriglobus tundricola]QJW98509.1 hypothetical protein FTUN_6099 [Frigoriglobus tundricola]
MSGVIDPPTGTPLRVTIEPLNEPHKLQVTYEIPITAGAGPTHDYFFDRHGETTLDLTGYVSLGYQRELERAVDKLGEYFRAPPVGTPDPALFTPDKPVSAAEVRSFLGNFAADGYRVYRTLFELFEAPTNVKPSGLSVNDFERGKAALKEYLQTPRRINIAVYPEHDILYPWAFLFDRPPSSWASDADAVRSCFGLRHQIEERFKWSPSRLKCFPGPDRRVVAAVCPSADPAGWHAGEEHPLARRAKTDTVHRIGTVSALRDELKNCDADVVYFFGHAKVADAEVAEENWLALGAEKLTAFDLMPALEFVYRREAVLAFLNACQTVPLRYLTQLSILGQFTLKQAHAGRVRCIATSARIPTGFAAQFAREFWSAFLPKPEGTGEPLWAALYQAKRRMLEKLNNPLGMLYVLLGSGNLHYRSCQAAKS